MITAHWVEGNTAQEVRYRQEQPGTLPTRQLWRIPHDTERVNVNAGDYRYRPNVGMTGRGPVRQEIVNAGVARPEIFRVFPSQTTPIGEAHQWLWRNINYELSATRHCTLYGNKLAWTNQTGFPGRRNYVLQQDMTAQLPTFHAALLNGGQVVEGEERDGRVYIRSLLISDPVPSASDVLASRLWGWGTSINPEGEINLIMRLGLDGTNKPVRILWLTKEPVWLPAVELHELPTMFSDAGMPLPDARWMP